MVSLRLAVAALTSSMMACCGSGDETAPGPGTEQPARCASHIGDQPTGTRDLALGRGNPFVPYADGEPVELIVGYQGGYMVTPSIRVPAASGDGDEACWRVALQNAFGDGGEPPASSGLTAMLVFERRGEELCVDDLYDLLGLDRTTLAGRTLFLTVSVTGQDFRAARAVSIDLE